MTKQNPVLEAQIRDMKGRKVRHLRAEGKTPGSMYGKDVQPISLQFLTKDVEKAYDEAGESQLVDLMIEGKKNPILFKNPQFHPVTSNLMHIDLHKVNLKEKITATVPVEFIGESPAVKLGMELVEVTMEVEVEALPTDLPEKFEVDLSKMETLESQITVADLPHDDRVEIKTDPEQVVVKVQEHKEEVVEETVVAPSEVPATEQKTAEEIAASEAEKNEEK